MLLSIDYLEMNLHFSDPTQFLSTNQTFGYFSLIKQQYGSKNFRNMYQVYLLDRLVGTLQVNPRSNVLKEESGLFKFENSVYYTGHAKQIYFELKRALNFQFENFTRLDLCLDVEMSNPTFHIFCKKLIDNEIDNYGRTASLQLYYGRQNGERKPESLLFGSRSSKRYVRMYNKTVELEKSAKKYIPEYWKINGFEPLNCFRVELVLKSKRMREIGHEMIFKNVFRKGGIHELYVGEMKEYFDFYILGSDNRPDRNEKYQFIEYDKIPIGCKWVSYSNSVVIKEAGRQLLICARTLVRQWYDYNFDDKYLVPISEMLKHNGFIEGQLHKKLPDWIEEFTMRSPHLKYTTADVVRTKIHSLKYMKL
jgi:hypothetical protein